MDQVHPYDILAMNGASAALMVSDIPFPKAVGAVRIGKIEAATSSSTRPTRQRWPTDMDLVVSGTAEAILMVEAGATEIPEAEILDALDIAHGEIKRARRGDEKTSSARRSRQVAEDRGFRSAGRPRVCSTRSRASCGGQLDDATQVFGQARRARRPRKAVEEQVLAKFSADEADAEYGERRQAAQLAFDKLEKSIIRERIAVHKKRPDGRNTTEIRPISVEAGLLPRAHGSALFTRGQTQALSVVALGTTREEMRLDTLGLETTKSYFHHYNFPPFSVGEAGFMRGPERRDIGHGALAERALVPMMPNQEDFPYTCASCRTSSSPTARRRWPPSAARTLSLMDAGVPISGRSPASRWA